MGVTPLHQLQMRFGFQGNDAPPGAGYPASRLPLNCEPNGGYTLTESAGNLEGVTPQSPTLTSDPENWYYLK